VKLFIAIGNSQSHIHSDFFWSFIGMRNGNVEQRVITRGTAPWDVVRNNRLIQQFLDSDCDIFTRMDADQTYPKDYLEVMLPLVEKYKVIGPVICDRLAVDNFVPLMFKNDNLDLLNIVGKSGVIDVSVPHTNLFFIREVVEKMKPPWFWHGLNKEGTNVEDHADRYFIRKIHEAGYKTYINLDMNLTHMSTQHIDIDFHNTWARGLER